MDRVITAPADWAQNNNDDLLFAHYKAVAQELPIMLMTALGKRPGIFTLENYLKHYDLADWARSRYESQTARAGDCIGCGKCEERCPYELPIREKLKGVAKAFGA